MHNLSYFSMYNYTPKCIIIISHHFQHQSVYPAPTSTALLPETGQLQSASLAPGQLPAGPSIRPSFFARKSQLLGLFFHRTLTAPESAT